MFVRLYSNNEQTVRVEFATPIPLEIANVLRKVVYTHAPVWAFDSVEVKNNPSHHALPSELLEEKLKHVILQCVKVPPHPHIMRQHALKASLRPIPSNAKTIKGVDIVFKGVGHSYACTNAAQEFGISAFPSTLDIVHIFPPPTTSTPIAFTGPQTQRTNGFDVTLDATFANAHESDDASQRYAVSNVQFAFSPLNDTAVHALTYTGRGHYASPELVFLWGVQCMHEHLDLIEKAFVSQLHS